MAESVEARFARLLATHGPALERLAFVYAREAVDAEDLQQEIWLAIWRALPSFRGDCSERTFLFRIGHNRGLTFRARRRPPSLTVDAAESVPDPGATPDALVDRAALWHRLLAAVRSLTPALRQIMVLHLEGLSHPEIAEVTGLTENNVAVRLSRARARLKVALGLVEATR